MTFLFDIGNVLLKLHFENFHRKVLGQANAPLPSSLDALKDPFETGALSDEEFVARSVELLGPDLTPEIFTEAWQDIFSLNDPMWDVVRMLHQGKHRLILFSNTNGIHTRYFLSKYPEFSLFDHHHFSQEVGAIKPHPEFYQKAVDTYQLDPADTLYLDDLPENIATGKEFGFHSWQYDLNDHDACLKWLAAFL